MTELLKLNIYSDLDAETLKRPFEIVVCSSVSSHYSNKHIIRELIMLSFEESWKFFYQNS